jgi:hypothetical protein
LNAAYVPLRVVGNVGKRHIRLVPFPKQTLKTQNPHYLAQTIVTLAVTFGFGISKGFAAGLLAFIVTVSLFRFLGALGKEHLKLACAPYPTDRFRKEGWGGSTEYPSISSAAGEWNGVDGVSFAELIDSLRAFGFEGFESWEEIDGGGGDFLEPDEQLQAATALHKLRATSDAKGFVRIKGNNLHIVEIDKLTAILRKGRCLKGW